MVKKYELTNETLKWEGHVLYRIKALRTFGNVKAGELGGWVEKEHNLSHEGDCWVEDNASVYGHARVRDNAQVSENARVYGNAIVYGSACVYGSAQVYGSAWVYGNTLVFDNAKVYGDAQVYGDANVFGDAKVYCFAKVYGFADVGADAVIKGTKDYAVFKNTWSSGRFFTWTRSNNMWEVGCFHGTGEELIAKAYKDSELSGKCYETIVQAQNRISEVLK